MTTIPPAPQPPTEKKPRRWPWIVGIVTALFVGVGIGAASNTTPEPVIETATEEVESPELLDEIAALEEELAAAYGLVDEAEAQDEEGEPEPVEPATASEVGDSATITVDGDPVGTITVSDLEITTSPADSYGSGPKRDVFLIFTVDLEATGTMDVYEDDFYVRLEDGTRIDQGDGNSWDAIDLDDSLGYATVNAGEKRTGYIVFDVPDEHGELAYAPNWDGGPIVVWEY